MSSKGEPAVGVDRARVGTFAGQDGTLRVQAFVERDGAVIVDPVRWLATDDPYDLGRWR